MSVATEFAPEVYIPPQARTSGSNALALAPAPLTLPRPRHLRVVSPRAQDWSAVTTAPLRRPSAAPASRPLRLTRRGLVVIGALALAVGGLLVALASQFGPSAVGRGAGATPTAATVTVRPGDTLWSIATRIAPNRDPRAEVATLQRLNGIDGADLVAGQLLKAR